jgi:hypothetical protein
LGLDACARAAIGQRGRAEVIHSYSYAAWTDQFASVTGLSPRR